MSSAPGENSLPAVSSREIPFNYTSADDRQAIAFLLGPETVHVLDELRSARVTGRSAHRLMRIFGDVLIHRRNPYLFQELVDSTGSRRRFFANIGKDFEAIAAGANGDQRVLDTLARSRELIAEFQSDVEGAPELRNRIRRELGAIAGAGNVLFDPFTLVSHATDATDWRLHLPLAVVTPESEAHVAPLLAAIARLGLKAIPRGAGTGLTGGAVPLRSGCVMVNTERLNHIRGIGQGDFQLADGRAVTAPVMEVEAGLVTEKAMEYAAERGLVFATDPTSAWACTVGGNIAENAGGKLAVRWGTCIDNLLEWRMAMPGGQRLDRAAHQPSTAQDSAPGRGHFRCSERRKCASEADRVARHGNSQKRDSGKTSPTRRWAAFRECRKKARTASLPRPSLYFIPRTRQSRPCAWSFSGLISTRPAA